MGTKGEKFTPMGVAGLFCSTYQYTREVTEGITKRRVEGKHAKDTLAHACSTSAMFSTARSRSVDAGGKTLLPCLVKFSTLECY